MKKPNYLLLLIIVTLLFNCQPEDDTETPNAAPNDFSITISEVQSTTANLSWTQATDPDGDAVSYTVMLNNVVMDQNLSTYSNNLEGLTDETDYNVKIIAIDAKGAETTSLSSFTTTDLPLPEDFTITVDMITPGSAKLSWTASSTSENNTISYAVYLDSEIVAENINTLSYDLTGLNHNTTISGQVKAIADNGQTLIKDFEFNTPINLAPEAFELVYANAGGFSSAGFRFNAANDPEDDILTYYVLLNDTDVTDTLFDDSNSPPTPTYNHTITNLEGNTDYELKIKAVDPFGNTSYSNAITFSTATTPPDNFTVEVFYVQGEIRLVWDKLTERGYIEGSSNGEPVGSVYILDGQEYDISHALTYNHETESTAQFNTDLISPNEDHELQIVLDWGSDNKKSYSNVVLVHNRTYTPTTVNVMTARVNGPDADYFPLQFTFTFENGLISEFEDYEIEKIEFNDREFVNFVFFEQGARNKGYLTGSITQEDFNYLSQFSYGYIETKDENGYHSLIFQYTIEN